MEIVTSRTSKAEIDRIVQQVELLCEMAQHLIDFHTPTGLGEYWRIAAGDLTDMAEEIPLRFKQAIRKAQLEKGWAAE